MEIWEFAHRKFGVTGLGAEMERSKPKPSFAIFSKLISPKPKPSFINFYKIISPFFKVFRKTKTKYFYGKSLCGDLGVCSRENGGKWVGGRNGMLKTEASLRLKTFQNYKPIFDGLSENEDEIFV